MDGTNTKWSATGSPEDPCPLCGAATDDMQHVAKECSNVAMMEKRCQCWLECCKVVDHASAQDIAGRYALVMIETMEAGRTKNNTLVIMLGRPLDYQVRRGDSWFGPQSAMVGDTFQKLACRILTITLMAVIGLWTCRGVEWQRNGMEGESLQQILFDDGGTQESALQDKYRDQATNQGFRNRPVASGVLRAAINRMVVGIEYAPTHLTYMNKQRVHPKHLRHTISVSRAQGVTTKGTRKINGNG